MSLEEGSCDLESFDKFLKSTRKVLVVVTSPACPSCGYYDGVVEEAEKTIGDEIGTLQVQVPYEPVVDYATCGKLVSEHLKVKEIPTAIYYEDGVEKTRITPTNDFEKDVQTLKELKK